MGSLAWWHWLIIVGAMVVLFGAKRLPDAARGLGRSVRILKAEVGALHEGDVDAVAEPASVLPTATPAGAPAVLGTAAPHS